MNTKICKDEWRDERLYVKMKIFIFMPPTLKMLEGHIAFGLSVCVCVCTCVRLLTFEW